MSAKIIDGAAIARTLRAECRRRVARLLNLTGVPPGLAVIVVGFDPASAIYVRNKVRACSDVGIRSLRFDYPADLAPQVVGETIRALNEDPAVHGM